MRSHFSETNPPEFIEYQGQRYRLREGAMPARQAEQKLEQVTRALARTERQSYPAHLLPSIKAQWNIASNLMESTDKESGNTPELVMWNPLTDELLISGESNFFHVDLHRDYENEITSYAGAGYDDWARFFVADSDPKLLYLHPWDPLMLHSRYYSAPQKRQSSSLQRSGQKAAKRMLYFKGVRGYTIETL